MSALNNGQPADKSGTLVMWTDCLAQHDKLHTKKRKEISQLFAIKLTSELLAPEVNGPSQNQIICVVNTRKLILKIPSYQ